MKLTAQSIDGRLNEMLSLVQDLRDKLEKEKQDRERDVKSLSTQLDKERADRKEDVEALQRVSPHVHVNMYAYYPANGKHYRSRCLLHLFISVFYWTLHVRRFSSTSTTLPGKTSAKTKAYTN